MKVSVNDQELFTLSEMKKSVIRNEIHSDILFEDLKRRLQWVLNHKFDMCLSRMKSEWDAKLSARGIKSVPLNVDEYVALVLSQPDYKDCAARQAAAKEEEDRLNQVF